MQSKTQIIIDIWEELGKETVGAEELDVIQRAVVQRLGNDAAVSPASIARTLADHGARLGHPEILLAAANWHERRLCEWFNEQDLTFETLEDAMVLIGKIEELRGKVELEPLRQTVRQIKGELELLARNRRTIFKTRELAEEVAQWLTVWLQNPQIFSEWLELRRSTAEFRERFF